MIGVQLYPFERTRIEQDLPSVLRALRDIGFAAVEGYPDHFENYRADLEALGMRYAAAHIVPSALEEPEPLIAYLQAIGGADVCCSGLLKGAGRSVAAFADTATFLNEQGRILKAAGIALHYHNHEFEFQPLQGRTTGMDVLLRDLDFDAVDLCLDVGWLWRAGTDPAAFLAAHAARISYVHLRDFQGAVSVPLGQGEMNLAAVMASVAQLPDVRWLIVEHDPGAGCPLKELEISRRFLRDRFSL
jgi:sugar phosphate isomerase/epimerase